MGVAALAHHSFAMFDQTQRVIRRLDDERMQIDLTIEDPERFTQPWELQLRYRRVHDLDRIIYLDCGENDRNPVVDGRFIIAPPG